jgi:UDP-N-acetylglucosamine 2-epimerase (non-hydrolysing)
MTIFGTRPEAIKMIPVCNALDQEVGLTHTSLTTGQHQEMLNNIISQFKFKPNNMLKLVRERSSLSDLYSELIEKLNKVISNERPDIVLVHGDTASGFCGALAAQLNRVTIGHVEAGLRTYDKNNPWPEETNRQLISRLADLHFAPTKVNYDALIREGIDEKSIFVTGNTVIDALKYIIELHQIHRKNSDTFRVLVTCHRRENHGTNLQNLCNALRKLHDEFAEIEITLPVHLNPAVKNMIENYLTDMNRINLIPPQNYTDFVKIMLNSDLILTDSGGIQEEAPSLGIPVLVLRKTTERPEAVDAGTVELIGMEEERIINSTLKFYKNFKSRKYAFNEHNPFGDGNSSKRIAKILKEY